MKFTLQVLLDTILANGIKDKTQDYRNEVINALRINNFSTYDAEQYFEVNKNKIWNRLDKLVVLNKQTHIIPYYELGDKPLSSITYHNDAAKHSLLTSRSYLYDYIIKCSDREFEVLCGFYFYYLGAKKVVITKGGGEGGIDLFSFFMYPSTMHFLLGKKGPIRIIAQVKKINSRVEVSSIRDFCSVINSVKECNPDLADIVPDWFYQHGGLIVPWFFSHRGLQSGAISKANFNGIVYDDTFNVIENIYNSKKLRFLSPLLIPAELSNRISNALLSNPEAEIIIDN
jgi:hypothetical protein